MLPIQAVLQETPTTSTRLMTAMFLTLEKSIAVIDSPMNPIASITTAAALSQSWRMLHVKDLLCIVQGAEPFSTGLAPPRL